MPSRVTTQEEPFSCALERLSILEDLGKDSVGLTYSVCQLIAASTPGIYIDGFSEKTIKGFLIFKICLI